MEAVELVLNGTPDMALGVVEKVLSKPMFRKDKYSLQRERGLLEKCVIRRERGMEYLRIGILTF